MGAPSEEIYKNLPSMVQMPLDQVVDRLQDAPPDVVANAVDQLVQGAGYDPGFFHDFFGMFGKYPVEVASMVGFAGAGVLFIFRKKVQTIVTDYLGLKRAGK